MLLHPQLSLRVGVWSFDDDFSGCRRSRKVGKERVGNISEWLPKKIFEAVEARGVIFEIFDAEKKYKRAATILH